jgi:superoxide dismutase, Fe-Mn family
MTTYSLPALRYALDALEPLISADTLELHYHKHHAAYVKGANDAIEELADARRLGAFADIGRLEKNLAFNLSGHVLHSLLWRCLTPDGGGRPSGALSEAIDSHFGAFDAFKDELSAVATSLQGSGWGALSWDSVGQRLIVEQIFDHQRNVGVGTVPIIVLDMWEHAYYLQHQNRKNEWVANFWKLVDWKDAGARFERVRRADVGLR